MPGRSRPDGVTLPVRVGGCLSSHWRSWQDIGAETWVVTVLRDGYRVPFKDSPPPLARTPVSFPTYRAGSPRAHALRQEVEVMLAKGALEIARDPGPGFYSRLFLVEKATGGWRPVIDLSHLNDFVQLTPFKMETVASVLVVCQRGGFSSFLGSEGCVLSDPDPWIIEEAVEVHVGGDSLPVQSPVLRSVDCSPGLYQSLRGGVGLGSRSRYPTAPLPGRLVGPLLLGEEGQGVDQGAPLALSHPRDCDKREEVGSRALAVCEVSRYDHRYRCRQGLPVSSKSREVPYGSGEILFHAISPSSALAGDLGSPGFAGAVGSSRSTSDALLAVASEVPVVPRVRPSLASGGFAGGARRDLSWWMVRDHLLVGVRFGTPAPDLHLYSDASSSGWGAHLLDQNVSGVWSAQEKLLHINLLEMKALFLALQAFQEIVSGHHVTAMCDNSTVVAYVNKQGGTVSRPLCLLTSRLLRWAESFDVHLEARYLPGESNVLADVLSRRGQVVGTEWSLHPQVARALLRAWGNPSIDLFATCLNAKLPLYCSLVPDPQAVFEDAFRHPWDDLDLYAFPPFALVGRVIARVQQSSRVAMTLVAPLLAREGVVRRLAASSDPTTPGSSLLGQAASAAPLQPVPSRRPRAEPSRVATLKRHYRKSGFSGRAARVLSGVLRDSSSRLYQSRWKIFCGWCRGRSVAPVNASVPVVVDFLIHLRQDKGLSVSAVRGYCSALNSVLALKGRDLAASREITTLLRSFSRSVNPVELRPPAWDVSLVLQSLTGAPYEPLRTCDERFLAQKTLFLLALASAKRIGELHALSYRVSHTRDWGEVSFAFVTSFVAKTQDPSSLAPRFEGFTVPALPNARKNRNGRLLCPVRAVKVYLDRTAPHRPRCERLFVTAGCSKKEISKTTVSFWLRKTISRAYELSGTALPVPAPRARETRGIAPSILFRKNFAVDQVLKAGTWRRHTTFTRHFLRDIAHKSLDTFHLGPVVAAQSVV